MAQTTSKKRFILKFNTSTGKVVSINVPRACTDVTESAAQTAMQSIVAAGTANFAGTGQLISPRTAVLVETDRRRVF